MDHRDNRSEGSSIAGAFAGSIVVAAMAAIARWAEGGLAVLAVRSIVARCAVVSRTGAKAALILASGSVVAVLCVRRPGGRSSGSCDLSAYLDGSAAASVLNRIIDALRDILRPAICLAMAWWDGSLSSRFLRGSISGIRRIGGRAQVRGSLFLSLAGRVLTPLRAEPAAVGLALVLGILPFAPTSVLVVLSLVLAGLVVCGWALRSAGAGGTGGPRPAARGSADIPAALLGFAVLLAVATSASRRASVPSLILWFGYAGMFLTSTSLKPSRSALRIVAAVLVASAVLVSAAGIAQFIRKPETSASWIDTKVFESITTRVYSVFDNPNILAEFLALTLPLAVALLFTSGSTAALLIPAILLMGSCLLVTYSRGGWVAAAIGVSVVLAARDRRILALALLVAIVAFPLLPESVRTRAITAMTMEDSSSRYRFTIWKSSLRMARDYWASGVGLGASAFSCVYPAYEIAGTPAAHTHNLYLQVLVEMGVPGLMVFLWLTVCFLGETWSARSSGGFVPAALAGGIAGQIVHGLFDNIWYSPKIVFLFWAVFGLALAAARGTPGAPKERPIP